MCSPSSARIAERAPARLWREASVILANSLICEGIAWMVNYKLRLAYILVIVYH